MQRYGNRRGNSGVRGFALVEGGIVVQFHDGDCYLYDATRPGADHVTQMQALAIAGEGLATYINRQVRGSYSRKVQC